MKKTLTTIIAFGILLSSCSEVVKTEDSSREEQKNKKLEQPNSGAFKTDEISIDEELKLEETQVDGDNRYQYLSNESAYTDAYIVDYFIDMDIEYITVDFVDYEINKDSSDYYGYEFYDLINDNPKLRTFVAGSEYIDCSHSDFIPLVELLKKEEDNPETIFRLNVKEGIITELYIDICSG